MGRKSRSKRNKQTTLEPKDKGCRNLEESHDLVQETGTSSSSNASAQADTTLFTVENSDLYGRYLKASCHIRKGTLLIRERFLIAGPSRSSNVVCVGCHAPLENLPRSAWKCCSKCGWPVCTPKCSKSQFHEIECKFFCEKKIKAPVFSENTTDFGSLAVLRGLLLKLENKEKWKTLKELQDHDEERKLLPIWIENSLNVVDVIQLKWGLEEYFSSEEIHKVCGILEVNAFELGETYSYRGVFPTAAMMAHDCVPNVTHFENSEDGIMDYRAAVDIPVGTPLTVCYAYSLEGTNERRKMLMDTKFFECCCTRCSDPYELGTNMSLIKCISCPSGYIINSNPAEFSHEWKCDSCDCLVTGRYVEDLIERWSLGAQEIVGIDSAEAFLQRCSAFFHPNHYIPFGVKFHLCQQYGAVGQNINQMSLGQLEKKLNTCMHVMDILDIVTPGSTITRGLVLYEQQTAEICVAQKLFELKKISQQTLKKKLQHAVDVLKESISILELCYPSTFEYKLAHQAKSVTLVDLTRWLSGIT